MDGEAELRLVGRLERLDCEGAHFACRIEGDDQSYRSLLEHEPVRIDRLVTQQILIGLIEALG